MAKTVIFVLDRSGSMAGKKIEQARRALKSVLNNLRDDDLFNIVVYDDRVESFRPELQRYSSRSREEAERFVDNIREGGSTNIDAALQTAQEMIQDRSRPSYILFLTDGLPTAGEVNEQRIAEHFRRGNDRRARLFCFGVGYDVNARLLDRLSGGNAGTSEYVKPDEDIETSVGRFSGKMTSPVLTDIHLELAGTDINRTYPRDIPDLFQGGQIVLAGRYRHSGPTTIKIDGRVGDERRRFEFPAELASPYRGTSYDFVERLWAVRRVGDLIDQIDLHGRNNELVDELVALSTKYGLLTPYTSFLADERVPLHARELHRREAQLRLGALDQESGRAGVAQRGFKQEYMHALRAPLQSASEPAQEAIVASRDGSVGNGYGGLMKAGEAAKAAGPGSSPARGGFGGMGGGMMGRAPQAGGSLARNAGAGPMSLKKRELAEPAQAKVRQIGPKTFYFKNGRWVDSSVTPAEETKAARVVQFSEEYFRLARAQKAEYNQYFSQAEPVTVKLEDRVYQIEPAPPDATR
jgi:Ca-activated chloride channel family protein